jgi:hypothetical protein
LRAGTAARGEALAGDAHVQTKTFSARSAAHLNRRELTRRRDLRQHLVEPLGAHLRCADQEHSIVGY